MRSTKKCPKRWPILSLLLLLSVTVAACGSSSNQRREAESAKASREVHPVAPIATTTTTPQQPVPLDVDGDRESTSVVKPLPGGHYDTDDRPLLHFGASASSVDRRAVTVLVDRYHTLAAAEDGPQACRLLHILLVEGVIQDNPLPPGAHKKTCGAIVTILFRQTHKRKPIDLHKLRVLQVQTRGREAIALLGSHHTIENSIGLRRQRGIWKIAEVNDTGWP